MQLRKILLYFKVGTKMSLNVKNISSDMCGQRRFRSACAFAQSDQIIAGHILDIIVVQGCKDSSCVRCTDYAD